MNREIDPSTLPNIKALPGDIVSAAKEAAKAYELTDFRLLLTGGQFNGDQVRTLARRHAIANVAAIKVGPDETGKAWKYTTDQIAEFFRITRVAVLNARRNTAIYQPR